MILVYDDENSVVFSCSSCVEAERRILEYRKELVSAFEIILSKVFSTSSVIKVTLYIFQIFYEIQALENLKKKPKRDNENRRFNKLYHY